MPRILLIDDDDDVRQMIKLTLEQLGHSVVEARDGKEGLALYPNSHVDLVITDLVMPEKDGLEMITQLRRAQSAIKIIAVSSGGRMPSGDYLRMAEHLGAVSALAKPFSHKQLVDAVTTALAEGT